MKDTLAIFFDQQSTCYKELLNRLDRINLYNSLFDLQVSQWLQFSDTSLFTQYYTIETIVNRVFIATGLIDEYMVDTSKVFLNASGILNQNEEFAYDTYQEYCKKFAPMPFQDFCAELIDKLIEDANNNLRQTSYAVFLDIPNGTNYRLRPDLLDKFAKIRKYGSLNDETFANYTSVNEIEPYNKLILDWYAFDINELLRLSDTAILINPHTQARFTDISLKKMLHYPPLREKLQRANQIFDASRKELSTTTKAKLVALVSCLGKPNESQAIYDFHNYYLSLSLMEKNILDKQLLKLNNSSPPIEFGFIYNKMLEAKACSTPTINMLQTFVLSKCVNSVQDFSANSNFSKSQTFFVGNIGATANLTNNTQINSLSSSKMELN